MRPRLSFRSKDAIESAGTRAPAATRADRNHGHPNGGADGAGAVRKLGE